jgi:hypothetical protein
VAVVGINSNDAERYPDDRPENMVTEARAAGYTFLISMTKPRRSRRPTGGWHAGLLPVRPGPPLVYGDTG